MIITDEGNGIDINGILIFISSPNTDAPERVITKFVFR